MVLLYRNTEKERKQRQTKAVEASLHRGESGRNVKRTITSCHYDNDVPGNRYLALENMNYDGEVLEERAANDWF